MAYSGVHENFTGGKRTSKNVRKFNKKVALLWGKKVSVFTYFRAFSKFLTWKHHETILTDYISDSASDGGKKNFEKISHEILKIFSPNGLSQGTWKLHRRKEDIKKHGKVQ